MTKNSGQKYKNSPTIGKIGILKWAIPTYYNTLPTAVKFAKKNGDFVELKWSNTSRLIFVNHPDYVQHILKTNQDNYSRKPILGKLKELLGDGIFASDGKLWEQQHQLLKPALHEKLVKDYFETIHSETLELLSKWESKAIKKLAVDIEYDINVLMLRILIKTQLCSSYNQNFEKIILCLRVFLTETNAIKLYIKNIKNQFRSTFGLAPTVNQKLIDALSELDKIIEDIRKSAQLNPENRGLALTVLENAKNEGIISDKQVCDEIKNFIFAGFDTTASALTWTLYCVAKNKNEANILRTEISEVLQGKAPKMEELGKMTYTKMFLQESMRLYPPVYALYRVSQEDDEINGYFIEKNSPIAINLFCLHRHPDFWEEPDQFDPLRFDPKTFKGKAFVYLPFGQGKRSCIGKPLAMAELQIVLPLILQIFDFELVNKKTPVILPDIIIKAKKPLMMKLSKIKNE